MHRFVGLFVGCLGVAYLVCGGSDCAVVFVVLGDAGPLLLSLCNTTNMQSSVDDGTAVDLVSFPARSYVGTKRCGAPAVQQRIHRAKPRRQPRRQPCVRACMHDKARLPSRRSCVRMHAAPPMSGERELKVRMCMNRIGLR